MKRSNPRIELIVLFLFASLLMMFNANPVVSHAEETFIDESDPLRDACSKVVKYLQDEVTSACVRQDISEVTSMLQAVPPITDPVWSPLLYENIALCLRDIVRKTTNSTQQNEFPILFNGVNDLISELRAQIDDDDDVLPQWPEGMVDYLGHLYQLTNGNEAAIKLVNSTVLKLLSGITSQGFLEDPNWEPVVLRFPQIVTGIHIVFSSDSTRYMKVSGILEQILFRHGVSALLNASFHDKYHSDIYGHAQRVEDCINRIVGIVSSWSGSGDDRIENDIRAIRSIYVDMSTHINMFYGHIY